jgi:hypothetical protein
MLAVWGILPGGLVTSLLLALVNFLACIIPVSNNSIYQIVLAWCGLALPMTWIMNGVGYLVAGVNAGASVLGWQLTVIPEWTRAAYVMHGGVIHGIQRTAFNMCNFTVAHQEMQRSVPWRDPGTPVTSLFSPILSLIPGLPTAPAGFRFFTVEGVVLHESSHCLNVGAFGSLYHLVGFADQWAAMPWSGGVVLGENAHSELCAESGRRGFGRNWVDIWAPSSAGNNTPPTVAVVSADAAGVVSLALDTVACERNRAVTLDARTSSDIDGAPFPLGFLWTINPGGTTTPSPPTGSTASINTPNAPTLQFVPDLGGQFTLECRVTDGANGSTGAIAILVLQSIVTLPVTAASIGNSVVLDSASSTLVTAVRPTREWLVEVAPAGSLLAGTTGGNETFSFTPDVAGSYTIRLNVTQEVVPIAGGPNVTLSDSTSVIITV